VNCYSWPTKADARAAVFEWIEVSYNRVRQQTTLGNSSAEEYENLPIRGGGGIAVTTETCPPKRGMSSARARSDVAKM
jgi:hypothetical protein